MAPDTTPLQTETTAALPWEELYFPISLTSGFGQKDVSRINVHHFPAEVLGPVCHRGVLFSLYCKTRMF